MTGARPLLVTADSQTVEDVLRLAAAAAVDVHLATDPESARARWGVAPLVLVGADVASALTRARLPRRPDVVLVSGRPLATDWEAAVALGAEHVASFPDGERWLIDRLTDCGEGRSRDGAVVAVMGCGGGSGASTLAAALALAASTRDMHALLVDADPLGGGLDLLLGIESAPGARWADLSESRGRISAVTLEQNLPHVGNVGVLSWGRVGSSMLPTEAVATVLDAAQRAADLVIVDLPRVLDETTDLVLARARETVLTCSAHVRPVAAASGLVDRISARCVSVRVVMRADRRGLDVDAVAEALPDVAVTDVPYWEQLARRADAGEGLTVSGGYGRAVDELLGAVVGELARAS